MTEISEVIVSEPKQEEKDSDKTPVSLQATWFQTPFNKKLSQQKAILIIYKTKLKLMLTNYLVNIDILIFYSLSGHS